MLRSGDFWVLREAVGALMEYGEEGRHSLMDAWRRGAVSPLAARLIREAMPEAPAPVMEG